MHRHALTLGTVFVSGVALAATGSSNAFATGATLAAGSSASQQRLASVHGAAAGGGAVIVVLRNQHAGLNLRTQARSRIAAVHADQASIVASIKASGGTHVRQLVAPNAVAAHLSKAEVTRLRANPAVKEIVPDVKIRVAGTPPTTQARPAVRPRASSGRPMEGVPKKQFALPRSPGQRSCPFNPRPSQPLQEGEANTQVHASTGNPRTPDMGNSIATGKGVIVANSGMNALAGNPNFQRPDGSHVIINAPDYTADHGGSESYGDASSIAAQGTVVYDYSKALPHSPVPAGCSFYIKGDAPGASLVDLSQIDTPILLLSQVIANINRMTTTVHADVISESFGATSLPGNQFAQLLRDANDAAVQAGVTVVESSGDSGSSGTVITAADDPMVIAAGAVNSLRLIAMADGYPKYLSNNMAALSSGGIAVTGKTVDLVAPGWYGIEGACAPGSGGCPPNYPTESMRGTSEAAPLIAGAAADVIQAYRDSHHGASPTPQVVKQILTGAATDLDAPADQQGSGLLNVYRAVKAAQQLKGTTNTQGPGDAPSLLPSPTQLDITARGGSTVQRSTSVYNTSDAATTVRARYRVLGAAHTLGNVTTERVTSPRPGAPIPPEGATAAKTVHFNVPAGLDQLDADMIWPDPTNSNILSFQLFNPQGALVQESFDDPGGGHAVNTPTDQVPNIQHAAVNNPIPGHWTAKILWAGLDVDLSSPPATPGSYRGPISFKASGRHYTTKKASAPVRIPAHTSLSIPLRVTMPRQPGDHPASVQLIAGNGAATSVPIARRTLIPSHGGKFTTLITSSVGREVGQISTYQVNVPAKRHYLAVKFKAPNASANNTFTFYLVNPSGQLVTTATSPTTASGKNATKAELYTNHPAAGTWTIDVALDLTTNGKKFTQTIHGHLTDPR